MGSLLLWVAACAFPQGTAMRLTKTGARNGQAAFSPQENRIAFVSDRSGSWQVWVMNVDGTGAFRVTDSKQATGWPSWDPGGHRLFYYTGEGETYQIRAVSLNDMDTGGPGTFPQPQPVLDSEFSDFRPSLSPDGTRLLFDRWGASEPPNHDIHVADLESGTVMRLTQHPGYDSDARFSPDGTQVLFHSDRSGTEALDMDLYLMDADGSGLRRLTDGPGMALYPSWCPSGTRIVFVSEVDGERDIMGLDLATGLVTGLIDRAGLDSEPVASPDGTRLLFTTDRFGVGQELATMRISFCTSGFD